MSVVHVTVTAERPLTQRQASSDRLARLARPALGLLLPVSAALLWEITVRIGLSDGRLLPPPSRIFEEFADLARTGELQRHVIATVLRVAVGFALGTLAGTLLGAISGYSALARRLV